MTGYELGSVDGRPALVDVGARSVEFLDEGTRWVAETLSKHAPVPCKRGALCCRECEDRAWGHVEWPCPVARALQRDMP